MTTSQGPAPLDRRSSLLAAGIILAITVVARQLVYPADALSWSYQVLMLCLVAAAIAGRALLPYRPRDDSRDLLWPPVAIWGVIVLAAVLPYLDSLRVGFVSDDFGLAWIARDSRSAAEAMRSTGLISFYRPLVMLGWWLADRLWGGAPLGHHIAAVVVHAGNSLLAYAIGRRIIGSSYGALLGALLFAVHPLHVEAVCWPAAGADLLCAAFSLASLLAVERYCAVSQGPSRPLLLAGALVAFALALLSKEVALALPGAVALMLIAAGRSRLREAAAVVGGYVAVLVAYLAWRMHVLGGLGGYALPSSFWNTYFPSNPLLLMGDFLFPVHRTLFAQLGAVAPWLLLVAMAAAVLWWLAGLEHVPARRLWLWLGFVFLLAVPSWTFRWQPSASLEWSRFGYVPTIGLAWLFGDLCAGRGLGWKRSGAGIAIITAFAVLTVWYVMPWREAGRLARRAVAAGVTTIEEHATAQGPPTLYVRGLPEAYYGAPVLANCYPQAVDLAMGKPTPVRVVTAMPRAGGVHPDVMALWQLKPGEYLVSYDAKSGTMDVVRSGGPAKRNQPETQR